MSDSQFLGTWRLVSWQMPGEDGAPYYPLGKKAKGLIVYAPDGYMFAALMAPMRPRFAGEDPLSTEWSAKAHSEPGPARTLLSTVAEPNHCPENRNCMKKP